MAETKNDDIRFAHAVMERRMEALPEELPPKTLEEILKSLRSICLAKKPPEKLALRALRHSLYALARDNDTAGPLICPLIHKIASVPLTSALNSSIVPNVAAGILLLFAHGLGQKCNEYAPLHLKDIDANGSHLPLVVFLGFAGGTPSILHRYVDRIYSGRAQVLIVAASEIPEVFNHNIRVVMRAVRGRKWFIHLFSKAGFLMLARISERILEAHKRKLALQMSACVIQENAEAVKYPRAIIWDSSPGSMHNFDEFVQGTWQSVMLVAKKSSFSFSETAKNRMSQLIHSDQYAESVRKSYSPILSMSPFPFAGCKHLFIFQKNDPVSSADEIRHYVEMQLCDADRSQSVLLELSKGTHCDGLWWCGDLYLTATHKIITQ